MAKRTLALAVLMLLLAAGPAGAFDTGPHADMTRDALVAEGFGTYSADVAAVDNWFVDFYSQAAKVPYSGHSGLFKVLLAGALGNSENWPQDVVDAAIALHVDSVSRVVMDGESVPLNTPQAFDAEFNRLRFAVYRMLQDAKAHRNPLEVVTTIGMSLHELQDFYAHTNWAETPTDVDGPDWIGLRQGGTPTWFDVSKEIRDRNRIYTGGTPGAPRRHGEWREDKFQTIAKDWPGRTRYPEAYMTGYFATRQWIRAMHSWLGDEALWNAAQRFSARPRELAHDEFGATGISTYSGHLYGEGGPCDEHGCGTSSGWGGTVIGLRSDVHAYFEDRGPTIFRRTAQRLLPALALKQPLGVRLEDVPVESSRPIQAATRFVRLRVLSYRGYDLTDPGPDDADIYARARIGGQGYVSPVIQAHDRFSFPAPYYPFTFMKAIPAGSVRSEPVSSITVRVRTSSARLAGTDDDVFLRVGPRAADRFALDKRLYDDFERGDDDTYSVPIDTAARHGLTWGDIRFIQIEKGRDGIAGGWKLRGSTVRVNGRIVSSRDHVERWLEGSHRTWRAPDFRPDARIGPQVPVWLDLREDDLRIYGFDDQGDINRYDARNAIVHGYPPGPPFEEQVTGGHVLGGRLGIGGAKARAHYRLDTLDPLLPPEPAPQPQPQPQPTPTQLPDLVLTDLTYQNFTVTNQGQGPAGDFNVLVTGYPAVRITGGLAPGQSATRTWATGPTCGGTFTGHADASSEVAETNESNNDRSVDVIC